MGRRTRHVLVALALTLAPAVLAAEAGDGNDWSYALYLLRQEDTYRAIGALKHDAFLHEGTRRADLADLFIGKIYSDAGQSEAARFHFMHVATEGDLSLRFPAALLELQQLCVKEHALTFCEAALQQLSDPTGLGLEAYLRGYFDVEVGRPPDPKLPSTVSATLAPKSQALLAAYDARLHLSLRSPALAGVLSAVVPGLGQVYDGRYVDGLLALILTGLPAWGAYRTLDQPRPNWAAGVPLGMLGLVFYLGSIANAVTDAHLLNDQEYQKFNHSLEQKLWPRFTIAVSPNSFQIGYRFGEEPAVPLHLP